MGQPHENAFVLALISGRTDALRVASALRPLPVRIVTTVAVLQDVLADNHASCGGILVEARDANGEPVTPFISGLTNSHGRFPVLGYVGMGPLYADALRELARAGVHELVFRGMDDTPALLALKFSRGEEAAAAAAVLARIASSTPPRLRAMTDYVVNFPRESHALSAVAQTLGIHRKTLVNWCARANVPPPGTVITWCRVLLAAELLQHRGRVVERVANSLEFASASAFRNLCQRYLKRRPSELVLPGALDDAYAAFGTYMSTGALGRSGQGFSSDRGGRERERA